MKFKNPGGDNANLTAVFQGMSSSFELEFATYRGGPQEGSLCFVLLFGISVDGKNRAASSVIKVSKNQ